MATRSTVATVLAAVLLLALPVLPAVAGQPVGVERLGDGVDVVTSAIDTSRGTFADSTAEYVVIGRDDSFPDNLAATSLAGTRGPLLYTTGGPSASLRPEVRAEVERLVTPLDSACTTADAEQGFHVYLVGGTNAVSTTVEDELVAAGYCVLRLGGDSRYETAATIASEVRRRFGSDRVLVARADDWADAATGGAYAAYADVPIIVTDTTALHPAAEAFLAEPGVAGLPATRRAIVLGGEAAISVGVEDDIAVYADTTRVAGAARDLTALAIEAQLWHLDAGTGRQLVNGYAEVGWAHAFAAAPAAGVARTPQLYTFGDVLIESSCQHLVGEGVRSVVGVGPEPLMLPQVLDAALAAMTQGSCDGGAGATEPETLAFVVDEFVAANEGVTQGLWVAETSGANPRLVRAGAFFGRPSWDASSSAIAVSEDADGDGAAESVALVGLDGSHRILYSATQPGGTATTVIGSIAINPRVTKVVEVAFEEVTFDDAFGGDPVVDVIVFSAKGGAFPLTDSGSAQMSIDAYSADGRLTIHDAGMVRYQPGDVLELVDLWPGSFALPEWSADGDIAFNSPDGFEVALPGANGGPVMVFPEQVNDHDWFPDGDRLAYSWFDGDTQEQAVAVYDLKGTNPGVEQVLVGVGSPEVAPDGAHVAVIAGEVMQVVDLDGGEPVTVMDGVFSYAYPPHYAVAG